MASTTLFSATFFLALLATTFTRVSAHGMMCTPRQRGAYHSVKCGSDLPKPENPAIDHCAHCLNGGTVATTKKNLPPGGWKNYEPTIDFPGTAARAGLCGDAKGKNDHMVGGSFMPYSSVPIVANYKSGATVDFSVEIDTNHNGYFDFYLCDLDACGTDDLSEDCFTGGYCYQLNRVKHTDCEDPKVDTNFECGPVDAAYPGRWYVPCRSTAHVGVHVVGGNSGTMRYKLPDGVECKHCVIQWYWGTANSCAPSGFLDFFTTYNNPFGTSCPSDGGGLGAHRKGMTECGGDLVPEEFWSCADVQTSKDGEEAAPNAGVTSPPQKSEPSTPAPPTVTTTPSTEEQTPNDELIVTIVPSDESTEETEMDGLIEKAEESPEGDVNEDVEQQDVAEMTTGENGFCIVEGGKCNGEVPCCIKEQVCVFVNAEPDPSCKFWWSLGSEKQFVKYV